MRMNSAGLKTATLVTGAQSSQSTTPNTVLQTFYRVSHLKHQKQAAEGFKDMTCDREQLQGEGNWHISLFPTLSSARRYLSGQIHTK